MNRPATVVCVDDEAAVLASLRRLLRDEPYDFLATGRPQEALDWVGERAAQVLIVDMRMPDVRGTDVLRAARDRYPLAQRVMLTGYADVATVMEAVNEGGVRRVIRKPWDDEDVKRVLRELVAESGTERQRRYESDRHRTLGRLAAGIAHELGNPTAFILSNLSTLREYLDELARGTARSEFLIADFRQALEECREGGERIRNLVRAIEMFARAAPGVPARSGVDGLAETAVQLVEGELKHRATIHRDLRPLPPVRTQPADIVRALVDLLLAAGEAIDGRGDIGIATERRGDEVLLRVHHTGRPGAAPEEARQLVAAAGGALEDGDSGGWVIRLPLDPGL